MRRRMWINWEYCYRKMEMVFGIYIKNLLGFYMVLRGFYDLFILWKIMDNEIGVGEGILKLM